MTDSDDQWLGDTADTATNSRASYTDPDNANLQPIFQIKYGFLSCLARCLYLRILRLRSNILSAPAVSYSPNLPCMLLPTFLVIMPAYVTYFNQTPLPALAWGVPWFSCVCRENARVWLQRRGHQPISSQSLQVHYPTSIHPSIQPSNQPTIHPSIQFSTHNGQMGGSAFRSNSCGSEHVQGFSQAASRQRKHSLFYSL